MWGSEGLWVRGLRVGHIGVSSRSGIRGSINQDTLSLSIKSPPYLSANVKQGPTKFVTRSGCFAGWSALQKEKIFIELMTSDRQLEASREGSK